MAPKFVFERDKLTMKITKTTKDVTPDRYNNCTSAATIQNALHRGLPFSASGRTLSAILSLSYPNDLSLYTIDKVKTAWTKTTVKYSRADRSYEALLQEVTDLNKKVGDLDEKAKATNARIESLEATRGTQEGIMTTWQAAHLVFHALGVFAWGELSAEARIRLAAHNISDFSTLFYTQSSSANNAATTAARVAYQSLSAGIRRNASIVIRFKQNVSEERTKCAHPYVSQQYLDQFLDDLGARSLDLSDLERRLFHYLRTTSTTPANIQGAKAS